MHTDCGFDREKDSVNQLILTGPTIPVTISFDPGGVSGDSLLTAAIPSMHNIPALVDTGAQECYLDTAFAIAMQLPVVDRQTVAGSNGRHVTDVYLAQISIPSLRINMLDRFAGVKLTEGGQNHGVLLGRTFLKRIVMTYDGTSGKVTLTNPKA